MNRKGLIRRLKIPEWDDFEAKESGKELPKDIWKTVSAFCNTNGGNIVLGVRDLSKGSLEVTGVENSDKIQSDFITTLRSGKFNIQLSSKGRLFTIEGRKVITFRLPPMPRQAKPVYYNDDIRNTYIRQGATNQKASKDEIGRMLREASEFSSDSMLIAGSGIKEIDRETLRTYLRYLEIQNQEHPFIALKDIQVLEKCGAMKEGALTMAGLLLFGKTEAIMSRFPAYGLSIFRMSAMSSSTAGDRRWEDRKIYEENLIQTFFAAMDFLKKHVAIPFVMSADGISRTENVPQVLAIREALVNLLVHRDYFDNGQAAIRIHDDRIVFRNPGAAPFPMEQILSGCESVPRNPNIARVFRLPGWAEIAGSGMMKIFDNWRAAGYVPPIIRNNEPTHWFTIEFHEKAVGHEESAMGLDETTQKTTQKQSETLGKMAVKTLGKMAVKILLLLQDNPALSIIELAEKLGKSERTIERAIQELRLSGLLKRIGPAKGGHWEMREIIDLEAKEEVVPPIQTTQKQQKTLGKMAEKMAVKILLLLQDNPALSIPELAGKMGKSESAVERAIRNLRKSGLLKRVGPAKGGYWEIIEEGKN